MCVRVCACACKAQSMRDRIETIYPGVQCFNARLSLYSINIRLPRLPLRQTNVDRLTLVDRFAIATSASTQYLYL